MPFENLLRIGKNLPSPGQALDAIKSGFKSATWTKADFTPREWKLFVAGGGNQALKEGKTIQDVFRDGRKALAAQQSQRPPHSKAQLTRAREEAISNKGNIGPHDGNRAISNSVYYEAGNNLDGTAARDVEALGKDLVFDHMSPAEVKKTQQLIIQTFKDAGGVAALKKDPSKLDEMTKGLPDDISQKMIYGTLAEYNYIVDRYNNNMKWAAFAGRQFHPANGPENKAVIAAGGAAVVGGAVAANQYIEDNNKTLNGDYRVGLDEIGGRQRTTALRRPQSQPQSQPDIPTRQPVSAAVQQSDNEVFPEERTPEQIKAYLDWQMEQERQKQTAPNLQSQPPQVPTSSASAPNNNQQQMQPRVRDYGSREANLNAWSLHNRKMVEAVGTKSQRKLLQKALAAYNKN